MGIFDDGSSQLFDTHENWFDKPPARSHGILGQLRHHAAQKDLRINLVMTYPASRKVEKSRLSRLFDRQKGHVRLESREVWPEC